MSSFFILYITSSSSFHPLNIHMFTHSSFKYFITVHQGRVAQSVQRLPTGWTVRGSNPGGGGEILRTCPDRPWGPPSLLYDGCRVFPGRNVRPGRDADPSPTSSAEVKNRVDLYLFSPYGPSWPMKGWTNSKEKFNSKLSEERLQ
jgi:hypothetical protein